MNALVPAGKTAHPWVELCRTGPLSVAEIVAKMATGHSVYSPSGGEMSMTCEESLYLNAIAEDRQTYEAAEGTVAHSMSELWLNDDARPDHMIGEIVEVNGFDIEVTDEMLSFCEDFVKLCERESEGADYAESEKRVDISHLTPIPGQGGTMDYAAIFPGYLTVIDLKFGKEPVEACYTDENGKRQINKQLGVYASGVFREWDWLYHFEQIKIIISQPRIPTPISEVIITRGELIEFEEYAKDKWAATWKPRDQLTRTPSVKGCRWCSERAKCAALYLMLTDETDVFSAFDEEGDIIEGDFEEIKYSNEELAEANDIILDPLAISPFPKIPDPRELTTKSMAKLLRYRKLMENFFNSIERELLERAISHEEDIPWWKVVQGRANRAFVDDEELILEAIAEWGLEREDLYKEKQLSPAQFETVIHAKLNAGKKKGDKSRISLGKVQDLLADTGLVVKPQGKKALAPVSDRRRELPKDGDVFTNWDDV